MSFKTDFFPTLMFPHYLDISTKYTGKGTLLIEASSLPHNSSKILLSHLRMSFTILVSNTFVEERVCLAFATMGSDFFNQCLANDIPVASFTGLEIRLPNIWAFVYLPHLVAGDVPLHLISAEEEIQNVPNNAEEDISNLLASKLDIKGGCGSILDSYQKIGDKHTPSQISEIDLIIKMKEGKQRKRNPQSYMLHIKTAADSLTDVWADKPKKTEHKNLSKKQAEIIHQNQTRLDEEKRKKEQAHLKELFIRYKNGDLHAKKKIVDTQSGSLCVQIKVLLLRIEFYSSEWKLEMRKIEVDKGAMLPVYLSCLELIKLKFESKGYKFGEEIEYCTVEADGELSFAFSNLINLNFISTVKEIMEKYNIEYENPLLEQTSGAPNDFDLYFQLKYAGDRLTRTLGSRPDGRVSFIPDAWQIELLDTVDASKSAVVCAPTSCGKTFICYYAIEKVLLNSETDVVVFCVPTKALVNQVMADVYARFVKNHCRKKKVLQGILMRDYQIDAFNCQVLITTPYMLETLLSTLQKMPKDTTKLKKPKPVVVKKAKGRKDREEVIDDELMIDAIVRCNFTLESIKYIIIDEVHMIGSEEMGVSIERVVHMAPCPLLLLSATLGNLNSFYKWMKMIEEERGRSCELIVHNERYCELKPYTFNRSNTPDGVLENKITPINPLLAFSYSHIRKYGFSSDISFLPEELLDIYYAFFASVRKKKLAKHLQPKGFFKSNIINKEDVKRYEIFLIKKIEEWIKTEIVSEDEIKEMYELLVKSTNDAFLNEVSNCEKNVPECTFLPKLPDSSLFTPEYMHDNITNLILLLKEKDMLPCIIFNSDRNICNSLANRLYNDLEDMERATAVEKDDKRKEKLLKENKRIRDKEKKGETWIEDSLMDEETHSMMIDEKKKSHCLFTRLFRKSDYELKETLQYVKNTESSFIDMIYRGIGVHHNGMHKKYRQSVEKLFRAKHIAAVFSTETLSLGINMPCRTVVFAGESQMSVVSYKQMAGRAGRRGFDTLGNVVFYGMGKKDVMNLISSHVGVIRGMNGFVPGSLLVGNRSANESMIRNSLFSLMYEENDSTSKENNIKCNDPEITELVNEINSYPLNEDPYNLSEFFCSEEKRKKLVEIQRGYLTGLQIIPHSRFTDMFYANKECDPDIFIFIYLLSNNCISSDPSELITTLSHLFEIKYTTGEKILPPLPRITEECINNLLTLTSQYNNTLYPDLPHVRLNTFIAKHNLKYKNSYLLDFMNHGKAELIKKENGIHTGELWQSCSVIQDVMLSIMRLWNVNKEVKNIFNIFIAKFGKIHA